MGLVSSVLFAQRLLENISQPIAARGDLRSPERATLKIPQLCRFLVPRRFRNSANAELVGFITSASCSHAGKNSNHKSRNWIHRAGVARGRRLHRVSGDWLPGDVVNVKTRALTVSAVVPWLRSSEVRELPPLLSHLFVSPFRPLIIPFYHR